MIRSIQVSPNGPIIQGEAKVKTVRIFQTGQQEPTGRATITIGTQRFSGKLLPSLRTP